MDKEKQTLQELREKGLDIQLLFLKYLLDREVTFEAMGDFALQYTTLEEDQKWEVAQELNQDCIRGLDTWFRFLDGIEFIFDEYYAKRSKGAMQ
ncbi:hypothetical protein QTL86_10560 [Cellulosilyticum sp. ST5]|uniref:hypothetical protein n=1 Tax=Cellulosilyticum sp. ST5 TaxID=3055805 RepID=UPI003977B0E2